MIEAERVSDRQDLLPNAQIMRYPDDDGRERLFWGTNLQDRQIVIGIGADERRLILRPIGQCNGDRIRPIDDMEIGDNVPLLVPHESRSGPLRDFKSIERPWVSLNRSIRDKDYGFRPPFEH